MPSPTPLKAQLRGLIVDVLYPVNANRLHLVCERFGLAPGTRDEAFSSKRSYVESRLEMLPHDKVLEIAKRVVEEYPDDRLLAAIEQNKKSGGLISPVTRKHLMDALGEFALAGEDHSVVEMMRDHWPDIGTAASVGTNWSLEDDIVQHYLRNDDWSTTDMLKQLGFMNCSQTKVFAFLEDVVAPIRRTEGEQTRIVQKLNPVLGRDGYVLAPAGKMSGYPVYNVKETTPTGSQPADDRIATVLASYDAEGVTDAWTKALARRDKDPAGAITAAKSLVESICKHIIEGGGDTYNEKTGDLPGLYNQAAKHLNLSASQHDEEVYKRILGNIQSVVQQLAEIRNKVGDAHGKGRKAVKPKPRHAELAVNLAGSMSLFLISTWTERNTGSKN
jgi:hypothetical protein